MSRFNPRSDGEFVIVKDDPYSDRAPRLIRRANAPTIAGFVDMAGFDRDDRELVRAFIDGEEVPAELWQVTPPGRFTEIMVLPHGGDGDKILRTVLTIAVVVGAFYVGGLASSALIDAGWKVGAAQAAGGLAASAVTTIGNLAINAVLPPPRLSGNYAADPDPVYFIDGARNQLVLNQPVETVLGKHRVFPRLIARPYPEIRGDDSYYYLILDYGPLGVKVSDRKVGDTPIEQIDGVVYQERLKASDPHPQLASRQVISEPVGATLGVSDWEGRRTASDSIDVDFIFFFPQGLGKFNDKGKPRSHTVSVELRYREVINPGPGESYGPWIFRSAPAVGEIPFRGFNATFQALRAAYGGTVGDFTFTETKPGQPFYRQVGFSLPKEGTFDLEVRRVGADGDPVDKIYDDIQLAQILSKRNGRPVLNDDVAYGVYRFKGTDETSGPLDTINMILSRLIPVWTQADLNDEDLSGLGPSDLAAPAESSNMWEQILWAARNGFYGRRAYQDSEINFPSFAKAAKDARARGKRFDYVIQRDIDLDDLIGLAQFAGEGRCYLHNGQLCAAVDRPQPAPTHFFREGTARNLSFAISYPQEVHGYRVTFNDERDGYRQREVIIYVDGYTKATATRIEPFSIAGKVDWEDLHEALAQHYRNSRLQTVTATLEVEQDAIDSSLRKMSWVSVASRVLAQSRDSGVVRAVSTNGAGAVTAVKLDQEILQGPSSGDLAVRWVRRGEGGAITFLPGVYPIVTPAEDVFSEAVTLQSAIPAASAPQEGDEYIVGPSDVEIFEGLLDDAKPAGKGWLRLTLKAYAPDRFDETGFTVPAHEPAYDLPVNPAPPAPVFRFARVTETRVTVGFAVPEGYAGRIGYFRVWRGEAPPADDPNPSLLGSFAAMPNLAGTQRQLVDRSLAVGDRVAYRIQAVSDDGVAGPFLQTSILTVSEVIAAPQNFAAIGSVTSGALAARAVLKVTWTATEDSGLSQLMVLARKVAVDGSGNRLAEGSQPAYEPVAATKPVHGAISIPGLVAGEKYDVRGYFISRKGTDGSVATVLNVQLPAVDVAGSITTPINAGGPLFVGKLPEDRAVDGLLNRRMRIAANGSLAFESSGTWEQLGQATLPGMGARALAFKDNVNLADPDVAGVLPYTKGPARFDNRLINVRSDGFVDYQEGGGTINLGRVTIGGLGYSGDLNATWGARFNENIRDALGNQLGDDDVKNVVVKELIKNHLPTDFSSFPKDWTNSANGDPMDVPDATVGTLFNGGLYFNPNGSHQYFAPKAVLKNVLGERYKIVVFPRFTGTPDEEDDPIGTNYLRVFFRTLDDNYDPVGTFGHTIYWPYAGGSTQPVVSFEWTGDGLTPWLRPVVGILDTISSGALRFNAAEFYGPGINWTHTSKRTENIGDNGRVQGRGFEANRSYGLRALTTPPGMSSTAQASSATVTFNSAGRIYPDFGGTLALPSASFPGLANSTRYYFWRNMLDPNSVAGSYGFSTNLNDALGANKVYLGYYDTPASSGSGGGGGGGGGFGTPDCVAAAAWVLTDQGPVRAREVRAGMKLRALSEALDGCDSWAVVTASRESENECVTLETESGARLTLALNTPMTQPDGTYDVAANALGLQAAVRGGTGFHWERVINVRAAGLRPVQKISAGDCTFAAGDDIAAAIFSHNLGYKP